MRVLVTGGAGFIGSHLVEALVRRRHPVRVLDNLATGTLRNLEPVRDRVEFIRGDIRDPKALGRALRGVELVFHQAALRSVPKSVADPLEYHEVNATGTLLLLRAALGQGVRRVVFASSSSVYGKAPLPQRETMTPRPQSPYAASKLAAEGYCGMFTRLHRLETVSLRYFNVFGPRQSLENQYAVVIPKFIASLLKGQPPPIYGDGRQSRDFTYIENVVQANLRAAHASWAPGEVFNVASSRRVSVWKLLEAICRQMKVKARPRFLPPRAGDIRDTWADIRKAQRILGYRVKVPLEAGLAKTVSWFAANRGAWDGP